MVKEITRKELKAKIDRGDDFYLVEALAWWQPAMQGTQNPFPKRNVQSPATLGNH